ncbi:MAG: FAD-dependent monooxygenase, partial [Gammaproteobacteria bacterium]
LKKLKILDILDGKGFLEHQAMELYDAGRLILRLDFSDANKDQPIDIPQPVLLKLLILESKKHKNYTYINGCTAKQLIIEKEKICGMTCQVGEEIVSIQSQLIVGADGRYGKVRNFGDLLPTKKSIDRDFVWFNVPRPSDWPPVIRLKLYKNYQLMILPTYPDLLRIGFNIPSGEYSQLIKQNIANLHDLVARIEPELKTIVEKFILSWRQTSLLDIFTASLQSWSRDGLVIIGDAAHTLTPVLGQGVNHAISDAVILSKYVIECLNNSPEKIVPKKILAKFEKVRRPEIEFVQRFQMRQEKMLQLKGFFPLIGRKLFYFVMGRTLLKKILMKKIFYKNSTLSIN